jgi:hypothetical protein
MVWPSAIEESRLISVSARIMEMLIDDGTMTVEAHRPLVWFLLAQGGMPGKGEV